MKIKKKHPIYVSKKCCEEKHIDLLLIAEGERKHYVLINDFNRFICNHSSHGGRKYFYCYYLHALITEGILKRRIKGYFKINGKQTIKMPKKGEEVMESKIMESKIQMSLIPTNIKKCCL